MGSRRIRADLSRYAIANTRTPSTHRNNNNQKNHRFIYVVRFKRRRFGRLTSRTNPGWSNDESCTSRNLLAPASCLANRRDCTRALPKSPNPNRSCTRSQRTRIRRVERRRTRNGCRPERKKTRDDLYGPVWATNNFSYRSGGLSLWLFLIWDTFFRFPTPLWTLRSLILAWIAGFGIRRNRYARRRFFLCDIASQQISNRFL